jgi:hypothetical protein
MYVLSEETLCGTGMCSEACSRKSLGWLSHNNSAGHTRITGLTAAKLLHHKPYNFSFTKSSGKFTLQESSSVLAP